MPGSTTMGALWITFMIPVLTELNTGGTTEEMMQSSTSFGCTSNRDRIFLISTPYWSEVLMYSVAMRASNRIFPSRIPPMVILVLPMSMARSIMILLNQSIYFSPASRRVSLGTLEKGQMQQHLPDGGD